MSSPHLLSSLSGVGPGVGTLQESGVSEPSRAYWQRVTVLDRAMGPCV